MNFMHVIFIDWDTERRILCKLLILVRVLTCIIIWLVPITRRIDFLAFVGVRRVCDIIRLMLVWMLFTAYIIAFNLVSILV